MSLVASRLSPNQVRLEVGYPGQQVGLSISYSSTGSGINTLSSSFVNISTNEDLGGGTATATVEGGKVYTLTHSSDLSASNAADQDVQINTSSGNSVSWGYEDGGGSGSTGIAGGETDADYTDLVITITITSASGGTEQVSKEAGPKPAVTPWSALLPTCATKPTVQPRTNSGMIISEDGSDGIKLNLRNYANQLVTLKVVRQGSGAWQNGFGFSASNASDILVNGSPQGGSPYNRSSYSNSNVGGTTHTIYLCNLDGGNYDYTFSHSSVPGPRPTRTNYRVECTTSSEDVTETIDDVEVTKTVTTTTCAWVPYSETYTGAWPHCYVGVGIKKPDGNEVSWCYEDGGGTPFCDQTVTVTVVNIREAIRSTGSICFRDLISQVWIDDPSVTRTNTAKIWSNGITSSELLISGTERLMFDGLTNTKVITAEDGVAGFIDWNKDNAVNLVGLTGPVKLQMVYKDTHTFTVNGSPVSIAAPPEDGDIALVEIAASGTTVNSFRIEAIDNQTPVEIYAVTQGASDTVVVDDANFIVEGRSLVDYRDHSTKIRFRKPASKASKTTFEDPLCFPDFRGIAGAKTPSELGL